MANGGGNNDLIAQMQAAMGGSSAPKAKIAPKPKGTPKAKASQDSALQAAMKAAMAGAKPLPVGVPKVKAGLSNANNLLAQMNARPVNADAKTLQYITSANRLNAQAASLDGKPVFQKHTSIFGRVMDVLSRGMYSTASATTAGMDASAKDRYKGGGFLHQLEQGAKAMPHGFVQGLEGKQKKSWSEVLQKDADNQLAKKKHLDPTTTTGKGKLNPIVKHGVGLGLDIALDPTTYTGVGAISKIAHGKELAKAGEAAVAAGENYKTATNSANAIAGALGRGAQGGKRGRIVLDEAQRAKHVQQAKPIIDAVADIHAKKAGEAAYKAVHGTKTPEEVINEAAQTARRDLHASVPLGTIVDDSKEAAIMKAAAEKAKKEISNLTRTGAMNSRKETATTLTEILDRNLNANTRKALQLRVGGAHVGSVMAPELLSKAVKRTFAMPPIAATKNLFDKGFKSGSARLFPAIHQMHRTEEGIAGKVMAAHADNINSVFNVSKADRVRTWQQAATGAFKAGLKGGLDHRSGVAKPVNNLAEHFYAEIGRIGNAIEDEGLHLNEINRFIPRSATSKDDNLVLSQAAHTKGGELDPNWLQNEVLAKWGPKLGEDPGKALYLLRSAYQKAVANKALHNAIADGFGVADKGHAATALKKQGYRSVKRQTSALDDALPYHQGLLYHPDIADHIEALHDMTRERKSTSEVMKAIDHATQIFKGTVTKYSPGFHSRNLLGEVMNSYMAGVKDPRVYTRAAKVLHRRDSQFLGVGPAAEQEAARLTRQIANATSGSAMTVARSIENPNHIILSNRLKGGRPRFRDVDGHGISADLMYHAFLENGIDSGFIASEFKHTADGARGGIVGKAARGVDHAATTTAQTIENYARMAHFIDAISKSKASTFVEAAKDAATVVRKYHFDYNDFSHFEKNTMSRVIPFYKWTRKNIPLMTEMLFAEPGRAIAPYKALNEASGALGFDRNNDSPVPNAESIMPQYLKDAMAIPVGHHGKNTVYENAALPFGQAFQMFGGGGAHGLAGSGSDFAGNVGQMLNPGLKIPAELLTGNKVGGAPITDKKKYFLGMTPYTNLGQKLVANSNAGPTNGPKGSIFSDPALLQFLTGLGLVENTPASIRGAAKQAQTAATARRKDALKKKGIKGNVKP